MKKLILFTLFTILTANIAFVKTMNLNQKLRSVDELTQIFNSLTLNIKSEDEALDLIKETLKKDAYINYNDPTLRWIITTSIQRNYNKILQFFLEQPGMDINYTSNDTMPLLVSTVIRCTNFDAVKMLLNKGANITFKSLSDRNILFFTMTDFTKELDNLIELLLYTAKNQIPDKFSEFLNNQDRGGDTALNRAIINGYINAVKKLLEAGADPNITNNKKQNAYDLAKSRSNSDRASIEYNNNILAIIKLLDEHKQKIKQQLKDVKILGECNIPGIIDIIADY